jgi:hypothetical protein
VPALTASDIITAGNAVISSTMRINVVSSQAA